MATATNKNGAAMIDEDSIGHIVGLTVNGEPVHVEMAGSKIVRLVTMTGTVESANRHVYAVNSAPKTCPDVMFRAPNIRSHHESADVRIVRFEETDGDSTGHNRCSRYSTTVRFGMVQMDDGTRIAVDGYYVHITKNRSDSKNATGTKRGSLIGQWIVGTMVEAVKLKHYAPHNAGPATVISSLD